MSDNPQNPAYQEFPPGMYGFGCPVYPPAFPQPGMMNPAMAHYHAQMHAMALQQAQALQHQAAQYQAMMAAQAGMNPGQQPFQPPQSPQPVTGATGTPVSGASVSEQPVSGQSMAGPSVANHAGPQFQPQQFQPQQQASQPPFGDDLMMQQGQAMLENALGEEDAGLFKELLGSLGMNDKEFWKGALIGAAAALVLGNENVRKGIAGLVTGTGEKLKTGSTAVKDGAVNTASSVRQNVAAGGEIFRDTYQAGKAGFKDSVERQKEARQTQPEESAAEPESEAGSNI
ncbi:hypothetical protein VA7868_02482 [Vibrio aerogenes CECT 7868]|uniref:Uncharacterized protein n=1 Tax=Vibrio aerogenes CECT 7868 TaxID=1216006 RepID=A0A1M5ZAA2_9VIBR|nr:hypothetical protein [Vibrio aerogenes]SHI21129.1 hypothetical protein VA7868_02482 [Vibrio aerogenes CECT 7868]